MKKVSLPNQEDGSAHTNYIFSVHVSTATGDCRGGHQKHDCAGTGGGQSTSAHRFWFGNAGTSHRGIILRKAMNTVSFNQSSKGALVGPQENGAISH